jgi:hypothetical protein
MTIMELMIALTIIAIAMGAVYTGAMSMQRCFAASQDFADAKNEQTRLSDYLAMDLRRADKVTLGSGDGVVLTVTMQDYYDDAGKPRTPTITKYIHSYGDPTKPMVVKYRQSGQYVYRQEREEPPVQIARRIVDFQVTTEDGGRIVHSVITFAPKFRRALTGGNDDSRQGTMVRNTTLLRNFHKTTP